MGDGTSLLARHSDLTALLLPRRPPLRSRAPWAFHYRRPRSHRFRAEASVCSVVAASRLMAVGLDAGSARGVLEGGLALITSTSLDGLLLLLLALGLG